MVPLNENKIRCVTIYLLFFKKLERTYKTREAMESSNKVKYFMAIFFLIPIFFIGYGIKFMTDYRNVDEYGVHLDAEVTGFYEYVDEDGESSIQPIVNYTLTNGKVIRDTLNYSSSPNPYKVGDTIEVMLFEDDLDTVFIHSSFWGITFPLILIVSGVLFMAFLLFIFRSNLSFKRDTEPSNDDSSDNNIFYSE